MDKKKKLHDLQEQLNYLTFVEKECKWEEIQRVVDEMENLSPSPAVDIDKSYEQFLLKVSSKQRERKRKLSRRIGKISIAAALFFAVIISSVPNMIATKVKDFFEVDFTGKGITVRVNGSRDDNDLTSTYKSYDELTNHVKEEIIVPSYVPSSLILDRITDDGTDLTIYYTDPAGDWLTVLITFHELAQYGTHAEITGMDVTTEEIEPGQFSARFRYGRYWYEVSGSVGLEEVLKVIDGMGPVQ